MTSAAAPIIDIEITQGSDWSQVFSYASDVLTWKPILGITRAAPCVVNAQAHGLPAGWPFWIEGAGGMRDINRLVAEDEPYFATPVDADHVAIQDLSSFDFDAWTSGGAIGYYSPVDLTGFTARMQIRSSVGSDTILATPTVTVSAALYTITPALLAAVTALLDFNSAEYDLELVSAGGIVTPIARGLVTLVREVTR